MDQDAKLARHFTAVGTSLAWVTCGWSGALSSGISRFRLTERLTGLKMNEIILTGRNHPPHKKKNNNNKKQQQKNKQNKTKKKQHTHKEKKKKKKKKNTTTTLSMS